MECPTPFDGNTNQITSPMKRIDHHAHMVEKHERSKTPLPQYITKVASQSELDSMHHALIDVLITLKGMLGLS